MKKNKLNKGFKLKKQLLIPITLIILVLIVNLPLLIKRGYIGDDIFFHIGRIQGIADSIRNEDYLALIYPNYLNGYGYGAGLFYSNFFIYISRNSLLFRNAIIYRI